MKNRSPPLLQKSRVLRTITACLAGAGGGSKDRVRTGRFNWQADNMHGSDAPPCVTLLPALTFWPCTDQHS
jgi:hypothetical protein